VPIHLTTLGAHEKLGSHLGRVGELSAWTAGAEYDVALINTATSGASFGAEVAAALKIPTVWAIHESFPAPLLWGDLRKPVRARTEATIAGAAFAVFEADATRRIFERLIAPERCLTLPYGVDPGPIERERERLDVAAARRKVGISPDEQVVLCVGTVEPRKAQVPLAQAFSLIADRHRSARLVFVGGREDAHTEDLEAVIADSPARERIDLIPITPDVQTWYGIANVLVCASDVESLPRTALEAMIWETPVLATDVFGLPELIDDGETGWLCQARDLEAMASGLDRALGAPAEERVRIVKAARKLVEERHSVPEYGARIHRLLTEAAGHERSSRR
jgi:glycosyltransferase involved in cell wall biosynthesis